MKSDGQLYVEYLMTHQGFEIPYFELYDKIHFIDSGNTMDYWRYSISDDYAIEQVKKRINMLKNKQCPTEQDCSEICLLKAYIDEATIDYTKLRCFKTNAQKKKETVKKCIKNYLKKNKITTNNQQISIKNILFGKNSLKFLYQL